MSLVTKKEMPNVEFEYENGSGLLEGVKWDYAHKDVVTIYESEEDDDTAIFNKFVVHIKDVPKMIEALQETLKYSKEHS